MGEPPGDPDEVQEIGGRLLEQSDDDGPLQRVETCGTEFAGFECNRDAGHAGKHQAPAFEEDDYYDLQLVEWWSIKPNGDPVDERARSEDSLDEEEHGGQE